MKVVVEEHAARPGSGREPPVPHPGRIITERITYISMGSDLDKITEYDEFVEETADAYLEYEYG